MSSSKKLTCKGTLWHVFIKVYRLERQSNSWYFRPLQLCELLCAPLPFSLVQVSSYPHFPVWTSILYTRIVCKGGGRGDGVLGLRQINTCRKVPLQVNFFRWQNFALPSMSLNFLRFRHSRICSISSQIKTNSDGVSSNHNRHESYTLYSGRLLKKYCKRLSLTLGWPKVLSVASIVQKLHRWVWSEVTVLKSLSLGQSSKSSKTVTTELFSVSLLRVSLVKTNEWEETFFLPIAVFFLDE